MATTTLYVELVIIGLETMLWITSLLVYLTDIKYIALIGTFLEKLPSTILLLGILYILGLIIDRAADYLFSKTEEQIKMAHGIESSSTILIWKKSGQDEYFRFIRSKIRILRASSMNLPVITISVALNISKYSSQSDCLFWFTMAIGGGIFLLSFIGYNQTVANYYKKAKILEQELKEKEAA